MKKFFALALALALTLAAGLALAENPVVLESLTMSDGFTFAVPSNWEYMELSDEDVEEGYILMATDQANGLALVVFVEPGEEGVTTAALADALRAETESFSDIQIYTNKHGMEIILYEDAEGGMAGFFVLQPDGYVVAFNYAALEEGADLTQNPVLGQLLVESVESICYMEAE